MLRCPGFALCAANHAMTESRDWSGCKRSNDKLILHIGTTLATTREKVLNGELALTAYSLNGEERSDRNTKDLAVSRGRQQRQSTSMASEATMRDVSEEHHTTQVTRCYDTSTPIERTA